MNQAPFRAVVDASTGIKLFLDEPFSEQVHTLFAKLAEDPHAELYVPDLFFIECANILWKYVRRYGRTLEDSQTDLSNLKKLALISISTTNLAEEALNLADSNNISVYDACYAALARQLNISVITADRRLVQAIDWAVWLGDLQ